MMIIIKLILWLVFPPIASNIIVHSGPINYLVSKVKMYWYLQELLSCPMCFCFWFSLICNVFIFGYWSIPIAFIHSLFAKLIENKWFNK